MKQYFYTRTDSMAMLHDSVTDAVACATVMLTNTTSNLPIVKLYMTSNKQFVTHWLEPECRDDSDVHRLLDNAKEELLTQPEPKWEVILYNMLTNAETQRQNGRIGSPTTRLWSLLNSIPSDSEYQALIRYVSGDWPADRPRLAIHDDSQPAGYRNDTSFSTQVANAICFLQKPERRRYLIHGESDLKWDLSQDARDCLRKNGAVVWADVTALDESKILTMPDMTLDIAAQILARLKKGRH